MKKQPKTKRYWAEIPTDYNRTKIVWFETEQQGREYLEKMGLARYAIFDVMNEPPF